MNSQAGHERECDDEDDAHEIDEGEVEGDHFEREEQDEEHGDEHAESEEGVLIV